MKNILKQVLLLCLVITSVVAVGLFAACDNNNGDDGKDKDTTVIYTVTVEDEENKPVKGVTVYWNKGTTRYENKTTDDNGKATMELVPDTYDVKVVASTLPDGYSAPESTQVTKDNTTATIKLEKQFRYVVNLVNENGSAFYHENVTLAVCQLEGSCVDPHELDTNGKWSTSIVEPGEYKVQILFPKDIVGLYTFEGSDVGHYYTGETFTATKTELTIVIKPVAKTEYTLTVLKPDNTPADGVYVTLATSTASFTPVQTDADGKAKIEVSAYGEYSVTLTPPEGFAFDYGAYKTTADEHELTVKLLALTTLELKTEMTADEKTAYGNGFTQFTSSTYPLFYSFKNTFAAKETKYFAFTGLKTDTYVLYCKAANTVFTVCSGDNSDFTNGEKYSSTTNLAQGITVTKDKTVYFSVTANTAGVLEFVIGTPDPNPSSEVTFTGAGTKQITVVSAAKYATVNFTPEQSGVYEICSEGNFDTRIEFYASEFATSPESENDDASATDKNFKLGEIQFKESEVGGTRLFRVYVKEGATFPATFNVKITRTGDAEREVQYETKEVTPALIGTEAYADGDGQFTEIDLAEEQTIVKGEDGFYHVGSADGAVLVVQLKNNFRNFGIFTPVNPAAGGRATSYFVLFREQTEEYLVTFYNYVSFLEAYTAKCNTDGVYGVNEELKTMLERWAGQYINSATPGLSSLGTIADGNEWLIPCGYYSTETTPPVETDVIVGKYIDENDQILTVNVNGTYTITQENMMGIEEIESGTWVKNSENNYTFTYVSFMSGTYTVTRDAQGKLTFMEDLEEPAEEPMYIFEVFTDKADDVIVGEYINDEEYKLTVLADGTYTITEDGMMGLNEIESGTWVKNSENNYTFTYVSFMSGTYTVTRDAQGKLTFMEDLEEPAEEPMYIFEVSTQA